MTEKTPLIPAGFCERFLAFFIDLFPFFLGFQVSMVLLALSFGVLFIPKTFSLPWALLWACAFIAYASWFNSEGRVSLGKKWLGLRVTTLEGQPLTFPRSLLRTAGYFLSGTFFNLGFFWALLPKKRAWHDLLAKSRVVEEGGKSPGRRLFLKIVSLSLMASFVGLTFWVNVVSPIRAKMSLIKSAQKGLSALGKMENAYKERTGRYTDRLADLAVLTPDPLLFAQSLRAVFEPGMDIKTDGRTYYTITARARDDRKTQLTLKGPELAVSAGPSSRQSAQKEPAPPLSENSREIVEAIKEEIRESPGRLAEFLKEKSPRAAAEKIYEAALSPDDSGASHVGGVDIEGEQYFEALRREKTAVLLELEKELKSARIGTFKRD